MSKVKPTPLAAAIHDELRPAFVPELPFALPAPHRAALERAMRAEAWLRHLKIEGIVTGIANPNMVVFAGACERLSELMKQVRASGESAGAQAERRRWRNAALVAAAVGLGLAIPVVSFLLVWR